MHCSAVSFYHMSISTRSLHIQDHRTKIKVHLYYFLNFQVLDFVNLNEIILIYFLYIRYYKGSSWIRKKLTTSLELICPWALFSCKSVSS